MFTHRTPPPTISMQRLFARWLLLVLAVTSLSACVDQPPTKPTATRTRPTATPKPAGAAKPTSVPRPTRTPADSGATTKANWTVLVYLDGDNDLESDAIGDYAEMASVGSSANLNIITEFDRISSSEDWDDTSNGDWRGVKRFRVEHNKKPTAANQIADLGERNMGDPKTLTDFVTWGITTYPAEHYALIFWDHGASWPGVANDDSSDGDMLTLPEIASSLASVRKNTGVQKLDLIGFDACLMGQIDVLQAVAPFGNVAIGSADLEPGEGWAWNAWLSDLAKQPNNSAEALAPSIVKSFTAFYKKEQDPSVTLAAFDLAKVDQMTSQLDLLAKAMIATMPKSYRAITKARAYAAEYAEGDADISAIDLGSFTDALIGKETTPEISAAATALSQTIKTARIVQGYGADHPRTSGISIYFPKKKKNYDPDYTTGSPITKATHWDDFLQAFYTKGKSSSARSELTTPKLSRPSATAADPSAHTLSAAISGSDTAYIYYFVGTVDPADSEAIQIWTIDYLYPPGAARDGSAPSWPSGAKVALTWHERRWFLSNGEDTVPAAISASSYGSGNYTISGTYKRRSGTKIPVNLEFSISQTSGTLEHIWAFNKGDDQHVRPRELKPRAGDMFIPDIPRYSSATGDDLESTPGQAITFGDHGLVVLEDSAPAGEYLLGLMLEDTSGTISDQYADVTVK